MWKPVVALTEQAADPAQPATPLSSRSNHALESPLRPPPSNRETVTGVAQPARSDGLKLVDADGNTVKVEEFAKKLRINNSILMDYLADKAANINARDDRE
jgi:hypothetical protein